MRRASRRLALAAVVAATTLGVAAADARASLEYPVKAAFLFQFARFVEWPAAAEAGALEIGVVGPDPFGEALERAIAGKAVGGRPLIIRRFATAEDVRSCAILFVSEQEGPQLSRILSRLGSAAVLTVGEGREFVRAGGMVGFFVEDNRVRFEVNLKATDAGGLRVSSRLLGVAVVSGASRTEGAR